MMENGGKEKEEGTKASMDKKDEDMFDILARRSAKSTQFNVSDNPIDTGDLTHKDLMRIINSIPTDLRLEIAKVFAIIDDDSSGAISMDELASMFRDLGKPQSTSAMKAIFRIIDADKNGEIDFFCKMVSFKFLSYIWAYPNSPSICF